jgi:anti-anti-sigma factor
MDITVVEHDTGAVVIAPQGMIDAHSAPEVRSRIDQVLDGGASRLVLNLQEVPFLDSAGLAILVSTHKRAKEVDGKVVLIWPRDEAVQRILRLTRFDKVFRITGSVEEAIAAL